MTDELYMQRCLQLAIKGIGRVAPNPLVGCVIVHKERIIAEGFHKQFGELHAEVNAINAVTGLDKPLLSDSTLYVNLEPCSHFGKTPPCADLIIAHKIPRVVIGNIDPNPKVAGKGIEKMKTAGVEVVTGVLKNESDFLNRRFITYHARHRPYIILKWAQSSDRFMAPAEPQQVWLTNNESRKLTHKWRSEEQAVMIGTTTVETDNPELTVRLVEGKSPLKITIDRKLGLSPSLKIFRGDSPLLIFNEIKDEDNGKLKLIKLDFGQDILPQMMTQLFAMEIQSLIVEGGPYTLQQFITNNLWDETRIFTAPLPLYGGKKSPLLNGKVIHEENIEKDRLIIMLNNTLAEF